MNIGLWIVQALTALAFGQHAWLMLFRLERARDRLVWMRDVPTTLLRAIGVIEFLGAVGVVLPAATGVLPGLSLVAAAGLLAIMVLAMAFHLVRRERPNLVLNLMLGLLAAIVVYGRLAIAPF